MTVLSQIYLNLIEFNNKRHSIPWLVGGAFYFILTSRERFVLLLYLKVRLSTLFLYQGGLLPKSVFDGTRKGEAWGLPTFMSRYEPMKTVY